MVHFQQCAQIEQVKVKILGWCKPSYSSFNKFVCFQFQLLVDSLNLEARTILTTYSKAKSATMLILSLDTWTNGRQTSGRRAPTMWPRFEGTLT